MNRSRAFISLVAVSIMLTSCSDELISKIITGTIDSSGGTGTVTDTTEIISLESSLWKTDCVREAGGFGIYNYNFSTGNWKKTPTGAAVQIDVGPDGTPWVVNDQGLVYHFDGSTWVGGIPGTATEISVGGDGSLWKIGTNRERGGYGIYKFNFSDNSWDKTTHGAAVRIDVGPDGTPWVVNDAGLVYRFINNEWVGGISGTATDISVGGDGSVWKIDRTPERGGFGIFKLNSSDGSWNKTASGAAVSIDVDKSGTPWVVNDGGLVYSYNGYSWDGGIEGRASSIGVGN